MPANSGEAWCEECRAEESSDDYIGGVHASQLDPSEVRHLGCTCPIGGMHLNGCPTL